MIDLHPEIIERDGKEFVILTHEEFLAIEEALADAEDLTELRAAKKEELGAPSVPLEEVAEKFGTLSARDRRSGQRSEVE